MIDNGTGVSVIVTCADAVLLGSACETAVTLTVAGFGTLAGAAYIPTEEIVPRVASPPLTPFTCQVTAVLAALETAAVNCCVLPVCTLADVGERMTIIWGGGS